VGYLLVVWGELHAALSGALRASGSLYCFALFAGLYKDGRPIRSSLPAALSMGTARLLGPQTFLDALKTEVFLLLGQLCGSAKM